MVLYLFFISIWPMRTYHKCTKYFPPTSIQLLEYLKQAKKEKNRRHIKTCNFIHDTDIHRHIQCLSNANVFIMTTHTHTRTYNQPIFK